MIGQRPDRVNLGNKTASQGSHHDDGRQADFSFGISRNLKNPLNFPGQRHWGQARLFLIRSTKARRPIRFHSIVDDQYLMDVFNRRFDVAANKTHLGVCIESVHTQNV